jgi:hypothetical protein
MAFINNDNMNFEKKNCRIRVIKINTVEWIFFNDNTVN